MTILLRQKPLPQVVRQIVQRDNGAWFDPEDLSTMFQDAAGTTPVTALEQPVGLWLDKSQGLELGPEIVISPYTGSVSGVWTFNSTSVSRNSASVGFCNIRLSAGAKVSSKYKVTFTLTNKTGDDIIVRVGGDIGTYTRFSSNGVCSTIIDASGTSPVVHIAGYLGTTGTATITNISVREIKGNHATQSITASRPVISARKNLLTKTEDFADEAWVKYLMASVADNVFIPSTSSGVHYIAPPSNIGYVAGAKYTLSVRVKRKELTKIGLFFSSGPFDASGRHAWFDLVAGIVGGYQSGVTARISPHQSGGFLCSITCTAVSTLMGFCGIYNTEGGFGDIIVGDGTSGVYVYYLQLEYGPTATTYQRVNTSTDYDAKAHFPFVRFDGIDDYLNLPYMGLYANGSASGVYAITNLQQTQNSALISECDTASIQSVYIPRWSQSSTNILDTYIRNNAGTVLLDSAGVVDSIRDLRIESFVDTGINFNTFKNSVITGSSTYSRSGSLTLVNTTIGAYVSTTTDAFLNHNNYGLIITKSALSDTDRRRCEQFLAGRLSTLGVTLS